MKQTEVQAASAQQEQSKCKTQSAKCKMEKALRSLFLMLNAKC